MVPPHEVLSYEDIRGRVDDVLRRYWPSGSIPVDVEHIADVGLGLDIVAVAYLHSRYGIDGFLSSDRRAIYVDSAVQEHSILYRYRFTIAHELGHYFLNERLFADRTFRSVDEWMEYLKEFPEEERSWFEWQGYSFGGFLLAPRAALAERVEDARRMARDAGFEVDLENEVHRQQIAEWVGRRFEVSADVILKRGKADGLWTAV